MIHDSFVCMLLVRSVTHAFYNLTYNMTGLIMMSLIKLSSLCSAGIEVLG